MDEDNQISRSGLTLEQAALYVGVSATTLRRIVERGELPAARVGGSQKGRLILLLKDLDEYLEKQKEAFKKSRIRHSKS
jgi:excisionase family DNA binding protein